MNENLIEQAENAALIRDDKRVECDNCDWKGRESDTEEPGDLNERLDAGSEVPAGECPECGCLAYIVEEENVYATELRQLRGLVRESAKILKWFVDEAEEMGKGYNGSYELLSEARAVLSKINQQKP